MRSNHLWIAGTIIVLGAGLTHAQKNGDISQKEKAAIIDKTIALLHEHYIFPERIESMEKQIRQKWNGGGYDPLNEAPGFLESFEKDIQEYGNDGHISLGVSRERVQQILSDEKNEGEGKEQTFNEEWLQRMKYENFRLRKVERLEGNIGYFHFLNFPPLAPAKESIAGAMNFIRFSSAVIIDLRDNGGGHAETMNFLLSYFLRDSVPIAESRHRKGNKIEKSYVPSDAMANKIPENVPVYILVSNRTSSAAEGFAYTLQQYKRAVIVGEQTKGEGNPGQLFAINEFLYIMIPTIESKNPVSGKGIDGIGVIPDLTISSDKAMSYALLDICKSLSETAPSGELKQAYRWQIPLLENEINPAPLTEEIVNAIVGDYEENRKIVYENNNIYYINTQGKKARLDYIGRGVFQNAENKWLRLVTPPSDSPATEFYWIWDDGGKQIVKRASK